MRPSVIGKRPIEADATTAIEVGRIGEREWCRNAQRSKQVVGQADVVDERPEIGLESP